MLLSLFRVFIRSILFLFHLFTAVAICIYLPFLDGKDWAQGNKGKRLLCWWSQRTVKILGLRIYIKNSLPSPGCLIVSNHISFLDIIVLSANQPVTFLSKSSLRYWPVIGFIARQIGTLFISRGKTRSISKTNKDISTALNKKQTLAIFPEGTTTVGTSVYKFHSGIFQAAINTGAVVQPIAIQYIKNGKIDRTAAYIDTDNFIFSLLKIMARAKTNVNLIYCQPINSLSYTRTELASISHTAISNKLIQNQAI